MYEQHCNVYIYPADQLHLLVLYQWNHRKSWNMDVYYFTCFQWVGRELCTNSDWSIQFILELCSNCSHTLRSRKWWQYSTHLAVLTWLTCGNASLDFTMSTYTCTAQSWYWPFESRPCCTLKNTVFEKKCSTYLLDYRSIREINSRLDNSDRTSPCLFFWIAR